MKTKILLLGLFMILFTGCAEEAKAMELQQEFPADQKLLTQVSDAVSLKYNKSRNVESIDLMDKVQINYGYNGSQLESMDTYSENVHDSFTFNYDGNGRINSFTENGITTEISYAKDFNSYSYKIENGNEVTVFVNDNSDITKIVEFDKNKNKLQTTQVEFDDAHRNGTLSGTNNPLLPTILATPYLGEYLLSYNLSKFPMKSIDSPLFGLYSFQNTYEKKEILKTSVYDIDGNPETLNFTYTKLDW